MTWRGGENQIYLLLRGLRERGWRAIAAAPSGSALLQRCQDAGIPCAGLPLGFRFSPAGMLALARLLETERAQLLHLHDGHAMFAGQVAAQMPGLSRLKLVAHRRTVFPLKGAWKYRGRVARVIAISNAARQTALDGGVPAKIIRVVYSGLDFAGYESDWDKRNAFREKHAIPADAFVFGHAAALTEEKRQRDMLAAFAKMPAATNNTALVIAGTGKLDAELRAMGRKINQGRKVVFTGFIKDTRELWNACDAAIFVSEAEGLCTSLVEAQAAGLPAIITRAGGMSEVISEPETGVSVEIGDVDGIARVMGLMLSQPDVASDMGLAAKKRAMRLFSADAMVDGVLGVYRELLQE